MAGHLIQLQSIDIWKCDEMEVIVSSEGGEHEIVPADKIVFPKVDYLHLWALPSFTALCKDMIAIEMPELKTLELCGIPKLQYLCPPESNHDSVIQSLFHNKVNLISIEDLKLFAMDNLIEIWPGELQVGEGHPAIAFSCLKKLKLEILPKLTHVWANNSACSQGFHNLISVSVQMCDSLRNLFSYSMAKHLVKLQELEITECEVIEAIIAHEQEVDEEIRTNKIVLHKLNKLQLQGLPSFAGFYDAPIAIVLPELKELHIEKIPKLQNLCGASKSNCYNAIQSLFHNQVSLTSIVHLELIDMDNLIEIWSGDLQANSACSQCFQNLISITVEKCDSLRSLFSPSIAKLLVKLNILEIIKCEVMETIIAQEQEVDEEVTTNTIIFSKLTHLKLEDLPNLTSFCKQKDYTIEGSFLKEVKVTRCPKMEALPSALQRLREQYDMHDGT
ncbi:hypothetical protein U1Q18_007869 [Sarracenia purpurea var. burkii]